MRAAPARRTDRAGRLRQRLRGDQRAAHGSPSTCCDWTADCVEGVVESARLHKITSGLLRIACDLGLQSVADGVDVPEQVIALRAMGCTHGQGMAFSGPLDEYRLRRRWSAALFPVPGVPACCAAPAYRRARSVLRSARSHNETSCPTDLTVVRAGERVNAMRTRILVLGKRVG